jgi:hypothetical protein
MLRNAASVLYIDITGEALLRLMSRSASRWPKSPNVSDAPAASPDRFDGDGSVRVHTDRYHVRKNERYVYERLYGSIVSASRVFIEWLQATVFRLTGVNGSLTVRCRTGAHPLWRLSYAPKRSRCD